jgi:hypothetical protein
LVAPDDASIGAVPVNIANAPLERILEVSPTSPSLSPRATTRAIAIASAGSDLPRDGFLLRSP